MRLLRFDQPDFEERLRALNRRADPSAEVRVAVEGILKAVRNEGDAALLELSERFGGPALKASQLRARDFPEIDVETERAVGIAHRNVRAFARRSLRKNWRMRNAQGAIVGERFDPFERVGIYVPGGTAP